MQSSELSVFLPGTKKSKPFDLFGFVKKYTIMIIILGNFGFTLLAPFALMAIKPYFKATSRLQINPRVLTIIGSGAEGSLQNQYTDYMRTQTMALREHGLLQKAIASLDPEKKDAFFPPGLEDAVCASILQNQLYIDFISSSHIIELGLQGPKPEGLAPILNAVMAIYQQSLHTKNTQKNRKRLEYLQNEENELKQKFKGKSRHLKKIVKKTRTSTFSEAFNLSYRQAEKLQDAFTKVHLQRIDAEIEYQKRLEEKEKISKLTLKPQVEEVVANDWGLDSMQSWTYKKLQELRTGLYGLSEENRDRKNILERMEYMKDYAKKTNDEIRDQAKEILYGKREYTLNKQLIQAQSKLKAFRQSEQDLEKRLQIAQEDAAHFSQLMVDGDDVRSELQHLRDRFFKVQSRISELEVQAKAPSRVSIMSAARKPQSQAGSNAKKLFMVSVGLPFGLITFLLLAFEYSDKRITSARHIVQALGSPPSWPISRAPAGMPLHLVPTQAAETVTAKALRSLAQRIFKDAQDNESKVFLFNGIDRKSGVTEIVLSLATLLSVFKPRVLLIEMTSQNSNVSSLLQVPDDQPGLSDYLHGRAGLVDCLYRDDTRNIDAIRARGLGTPVVANLIFHHLMHTCKNEYDFIVIDADPIMYSDLTEFVTLYIDVAFLVVQGDRTRYPQLRSSAELFVRAQVPALSSVLNWGGAQTSDHLQDLLQKAGLQRLCKRYVRHLQKNAAEGVA